MNATELEMVRRIVYEENGIVLGAEKAYLIESRIRDLAKSHGYNSVSALLHSKNPRLHQEIAEAMTTNETSFFRDSRPFLSLQDTLLPPLIRARAASRRLRIWSAACSTGQEPYSIALLLRDAFPQTNGWDVRITASDYSNEVLDQARSGRYSDLDVRRGLSPALRDRYFQRDGDSWVADHRLKSMIRFHRFNFLGMWPVAESQDLILIRNVLIYFDNDTRTKILERACRLLRPDGLLMLGSAESPPLTTRGLVREVHGATVCYRRDPKAHAA